MTKKPISQTSLIDLFRDSLTSSLCVNIQKGTKTWVATGMLVQQLESFTDSVVVRDNDKPVGIIGGKDVISKLIDEPTSDLFYKTNVEDIMEKRWPTVSKNTKLQELMEFWKNTRRAFAAIPNEFSDYSAISAKKLLEVGKKIKTNISISDLPEKKLVTFSKDVTIGSILNLMLEKNTRRLVLENSNKFINDRIILEKISEELKYLQDVENFLDIPIKEFELEKIKEISEDLSIPEVSKIMYEMEHPCVIFHDKIVTPWDICLILLSEKLVEIE
jgi:predicted transcriptional regulator